MSRQTGTIITVVVALLTLCCSIGICSVGGMVAAGQAEWYRDLDLPYQGDIKPGWGYPVICLGFLIWVIPVLLGVLLARKRNGGT